MRALLIAAVLLMSAAPALADPCKALPDNGPAPSYPAFGATFSGPVAVVIDGTSLCVALGPGPENLVKVWLSDFYAPELRARGGPAAKAALERIALGKQAVCVANLKTRDAIAARCRIDGRPIGDSLRAAGVVEQRTGVVTSVVRGTVRSSPSDPGPSDVGQGAQAFGRGVAGGLNRASRPMIFP